MDNLTDNGSDNEDSKNLQESISNFEKDQMDKFVSNFVPSFTNFYLFNNSYCRWTKKFSVISQIIKIT